MIILNEPRNYAVLTRRYGTAGTIPETVTEEESESETGYPKSTF